MILITGASGFIGFHLTKKFLDEGFSVVGIDDMNSYYDVELKDARLSLLKNNKNAENFIFQKVDICDKEELKKLFKKYKFECVINLAAQAGVRYSIDNPEAYIESNISGFFNILECCRYYKPKSCIYASSSSVYGANTKTPFSTSDKADSPLSLYGATKKADEVMAYSYCSLFKIPMIGLRFFTVYGPWGRPDMALFKFTKSIFEDKSIQIYNNGNMTRDFTYIDDVIESIFRIYEKSQLAETFKDNLYYIFNVGNSKPEKLSKFVELIEKEIGKSAKKEFLEVQKGDVLNTYADIDDLVHWINFKPHVTIDKGIKEFVSWYREYYNA